MIFDRIENLAKYIPYMPDIKTVCDFLRDNDAEKIEAGHYEINDNVYVNVQVYEPKKNEAYEDHRQYIDLQYIVKGDEEIDVISRTEGTGEGEYVAEHDCSVFHGTNGSVAKLYISAGSFTILEPDDPHAPGTMWHGGEVKKMIFKIKVK